jgi:DNA (cytosine-5)-methyltransferase 1
VILHRELVVDLFAGGGGASIGIAKALGRPVDFAVNHSERAIAVHTANHPETRHFHSDVWEVNPVEVCGRRNVGLLWASPACTHFSKAKGSANPLCAKIRSLAWVVVRWARAVAPRMIFCENVEEWQRWGPLRARSPHAGAERQDDRENAS